MKKNPEEFTTLAPTALVRLISYTYMYMYMYVHVHVCTIIRHIVYTLRVRHQTQARLHHCMPDRSVRGNPKHARHAGLPRQQSENESSGYNIIYNKQKVTDKSLLYKSRDRFYNYAIHTQTHVHVHVAITMTCTE